MEEKDAVTERLKGAVDKLRKVVEVVADKALDRAIIIEETTKELDALTLEIEGRETELLGGEKVDDEVESEEVEQAMRMDVDPNSPTYNTMIPVNA
jgi:hypothetical protein